MFKTLHPSAKSGNARLCRTWRLWGGTLAGWANTVGSAAYAHQTSPGENHRMSRTRISIRRPSAVAVAIIGAGTLIAYALLAAVQILVWNPLAAVPGTGLAQIYSEVAAAGESMGAGRVIAFLAVGPLAALALLVAVWRRPVRQARNVAVLYLLLALGAPATFWASFGPAVALADTYFVSGGDHSPWTVPLYLASGLAVVALIGHVAWTRSHRQ